MFADTLTQLYLACTVFGWGFIIVSFFMGGFGEHGDGECNHLHLDGHSHGHGLTEHTLGQTQGHVVAHADHTHSDGQTGGGRAGNGHDNSAESNDSAKTSIVTSTRPSFLMQVLSIFNPTSISVFTGFVGLSGLTLKTFLPFLGIFSLIPAILVGIVSVSLMRNLFALVTAKLNVSNTVKSSDAIGHVAEVSAPIADGGTGEVTYVIGQNRFNAAAKSINGSETIKKGSKVLIVEREGHLVMVEPYHEED